MRFLTRLFLFIISINFCVFVELPSSFKKCSRNDPNFQKCLVEAVDNAINQLNRPFKEVALPSIDPLKIPLLTISAGTGPASFDQKYKNMTVTGFSKVKVTYFGIDFDKKIIVLQCSFPKLIFNFQYDFEGKVLLLPFYGKGPGVIVADNVKYNNFTFNLEEYEKNEVKYYKILKSELKMVPERMHFTINNLFNGDELLGKTINQVFNDNWKELYADVQPSYEEAFGQIFTMIFKNFLDKVPISQMFQ